MATNIKYSFCRKFSLCLSLFLFSFYIGYSQTQVSVKGKVIGDDGKPLSGVSVKIKNSTVGTTTAGKPLAKQEYFQKAADRLLEVTSSAGAAKYNFDLLADYPSIFSINN